VVLRRYIIAIYIESVPNWNSPPAIVLRERFRDGAKIKKRTIANLSDWPAELVEGLRTLLKGGTAPADRESIIVRRALPHGHVAAVLGTLRAIGLDRILGPAGNRPLARLGYNRDRKKGRLQMPSGDRSVRGRYRRPGDPCGAVGETTSQ
jgi:hypothetical protein